MSRSAEKGTHFGRVPYGYTYTRINDRVIWEQEPSEAAVVREMYRLAVEENLGFKAICDVLTRFAGNFNVSPDSGFGHPFDDVELEITATLQFNGDMTEADGNSWGQWAIDTPPQGGPAGLVGVQGSGNGAM